MRSNEISILVVDDDPVVGVLLQETLEGAGYIIFLADTGYSAVQAAIIHEPDLILLDIMLPDITGYDVYKKIKAHQSLAETPVIFISALEEEDLLDGCTTLGTGVDYILKPIRPRVLMARVTNILALVQSRKELAERNEQLQKEIAERNRLATAVQQWRDSVFIVDPVGEIVYANPACEENCGFSPAELVGKSFHDVQPVKCEEGQQESLFNHVFTGKEWSGNIQNVKKDGSFSLEEVTVLPVISADDELKGHVVIKKNITERRRLESIASSVNLMDNVGFVFSGIRHELGNPINSLKMTLSVLNKKIHAFPPDTVRDFLERSLHEIGRIEYLLSSLRSFSMFEHPIVSNFSLSRFLSNFFEMHKKGLEVARVQHFLKVEPDAATVYADERALLQVLLNLLTNALSAVEQSVEPTITVHAFKESENLVCLSFTDNGCGISQENQAKLFKPFFTTRPDGTGLGLVIVKKMLAEMECSIHCKSVEQQGTTFSILMPCDRDGDSQELT